MSGNGSMLISSGAFEYLPIEVFHFRFAKHMIDDRSFYGGILHVCYAPELESVSETRQKLQQRKYDVLKRVKNVGKIGQMYENTFDFEHSRVVLKF